jgi:hypothetical protein
VRAIGRITANRLDRLVAQQQQSLRVMNNGAEDAILQYGTRAFGNHIATGLRQIDEQAAAGAWTPEAKVAATE